MNIFIRLRLFVFFLFTSFSIFASDKQTSPCEISDEGIVSVKQIKIPGYKNAYNPSLIAYKDGYLLSFRFTNKAPDSYKQKERIDLSFIGLVQLDKDFNVHEKSIQILNIISHSPTFSLTAEDGRLLQVDDRIYLFFNDLPPQGKSGQFAMYCAELIENQGLFYLNGKARHLDYFHATQVEKNWSPFWADGHLYVIYSDLPRVILEVDLHSGNCTEVSRFNEKLDWDFGPIRGGTPALCIGDHFLTFFHSHVPFNARKGKAYVMGAYLFEKNRPYSICYITQLPVAKLSDYTDENPLKVIFPCGLFLDDDFIYVSWGKSDKQIFITKLNKEKFLNHSLRSVTAADRL